MTECKHRRYRINYPFGRKSKPIFICKKCGKAVRIEKNARKNIRNRNKQNFAQSTK